MCSDSEVINLWIILKCYGDRKLRFENVIGFSYSSFSDSIISMNSTSFTDIISHYFYTSSTSLNRFSGLRFRSLLTLWCNSIITSTIFVKLILCYGILKSKVLLKVYSCGICSQMVDNSYTFSSNSWIIALTWLAPSSWIELFLAAISGLLFWTMFLMSDRKMPKIRILDLIMPSDVP